jgi:hypothetical protein
VAQVRPRAGSTDHVSKALLDSKRFMNLCTGVVAVGAQAQAYSCRASMSESRALGANCIIRRFSEALQRLPTFSDLPDDKVHVPDDKLYDAV